MSDSIIPISYQQIDSDCKDLALQIRNQFPDVENIVAVSRGGLLPALLVSHYLGIRNVFSICIQSYTDGKKHGKMKVLGCPSKRVVNNDKTLFIDDLLDSGKTIEKLKHLYPKALLGVLYLKQNGINIEPAKLLSIYGKDQPNEWLQFEYEKESLFPQNTESKNNNEIPQEENSETEKKENENPNTKVEQDNEVPVMDTPSPEKEEVEDFDDFSSSDDELESEDEDEDEDEDKLKPIDNPDPQLNQVSRLTDEQKVYLEEKELEREKLVEKLQSETLVKEKEKQKEFDKQSGIKLSNQQRQAIYFILNSTKHILLTGKAGAGKSTIIKALRLLRPKWSICSTTGKAAVLVGGVTLDRLFCYDRELNITKSDDALKNSMKSAGEAIIVDEASMVGKKMFNHICKIADTFGKRLILVGDWGQAKPVKDDWFFPLNTNDFDFIKLTECFRQESGEFLECLDKLRVGIQDEQVNNLFSKRICPIPPMDDSCLLLYPFNKQADVYNQNRVNKLLAQEKREGKMGTGIVLKSRIINKTDKCPLSELKGALNNTPFAHDLTLAIGCKVLITKNQPSVCDELACVNGDTGTLVSVSYDGKEIKALEIYIDRLGCTRCLEVNSLIVYNEKHEALYTISGFPIKLGYALTIHKAQGMTIPKVWVDIKSICNSYFTNHGITYVALSRVRNIEDLWVNYWDDGLAYVERPVRPYL